MDLCVSLYFNPSIWPRKSLDQLTKESQMSVQKDMFAMLVSWLVTQTLCPVTIQIIPQLDASLITTFFNPAMRVEVLYKLHLCYFVSDTSQSFGRTN